MDINTRREVMQLVIDIPEVAYETCKAVKNVENEQDNFADLMLDAIANGTPIPDNATNGDVLISLYPNLKYTIQNGRVVTTIGVASSFDLDWWNSPYQKGGKE